MIGKLIVHGKSRDETIGQTLAALDAFTIDGVHTTLPFSRAIIDDRDFRESAITTGWLESVFLPRYLKQKEARA